MVGARAAADAGLPCPLGRTLLVAARPMEGVGGRRNTPPHDVRGNIIKSPSERLEVQLQHSLAWYVYVMPLCFSFLLTFLERACVRACVVSAKPFYDRSCALS